MIIETLPDIPRLFTGVAEWAACLVFILILKRRLHGLRFWLGVTGGLILQLVIQYVAGMLPLVFWLPGMFAAVGGMYLFIHFSNDMSARDAGYSCARAFVLAEFAASLGWQLYCYFWQPENSQVTLSGSGFMFAVYTIVFVAAYFIEVRHMEKSGHLNVKHKELYSEIIIALVAFTISNISFMTVNTPFSSRLVPELFYIRTLVDFCGLVILFAHQEQRRELQLKYELEAMQNILHRQFEQYQQSRENIDLINRKYHDLKHQIAIIRAESNPEKQSTYLVDLESSIKIYESQFKTGNQVLDTVLMTKSMFCSKQNITLTCVADGTLLDFMEVMDICTIFGNALDNAIESVSKLENPKKRLIRVALYAQNNFVIMRFENYFESEIRIEDGLPVTTKQNKDYHGFGLKSIRYTAEKYEGSFTIHTEDDWFILRVLIPKHTT